MRRTLKRPLRFAQHLDASKALIKIKDLNQKFVSRKNDAAQCEKNRCLGVLVFRYAIVSYRKTATKDLLSAATDLFSVSIVCISE